MSAHSRESERQNIIDKTHTWQQCLVIISEEILKAKYDFDLREIAPQCWLNGIDNDTNPDTFGSSKKEVPLFTDLDSRVRFWRVMVNGAQIRSTLRRISQAKTVD